MDIRLKIQELAERSGFFEHGYTQTQNLRYHAEVRALCEGNACRNYAKTWACPPAVGSLKECQARVGRYAYMFLFSKKYDLEDSFDFDGMTAGHADFQKTVDNFQEGVEDLLSDFLLLSNEGCTRCAVCAYPNAPCRFPKKLHPSLEGYGFIVSELAERAGIRYHNGANTVTYFGALCFSV